MLNEAPTEQEVYPRLIEFLGDAVNGNIIMCAHNANFVYADTLSISRQCIKGLDNYKQVTLEKYFQLKNDAAHRAKTDEEMNAIMQNIPQRRTT